MKSHIPLGIKMELTDKRTLLGDVERVSVVGYLLKWSFGDENTVSLHQFKV